MFRQRFFGQPSAQRRSHRSIRGPPFYENIEVNRSNTLTAVVAAAPLLAVSTVAEAAIVTVMNPICTNNTAKFNPDSGADIVLPAGFTVSVFRSGLNFPTGIAFKGNSQKFEVYVLESGHGLPSVCNDQTSSIVGGEFS